METVALVILLILAVALIGVVLLQRNEGGGLGMGAGGVMTGRAQATALARATWWIGGAFMAMSLALTVIAAQDAADSSIVDQINPAAGDAAEEEGSAFPDLGAGGSLLPPSADDEAPLVPAGD
jgi:preprotein translocase subunit SecG